MDTEEWRKVYGYPGYLISSFGRISARKGLHDELFDCILHPTVDAHGYQRVILRSSSKRDRSYFVHRLVAIAFLPKPKKHRTQVNHKDRNKSNNCADNLEWCSAHENTRWSAERGAYDGKSRKLTEMQVREIFSVKSKKLWKDLAAKYKVSYTTIYSICMGRSWRHITAGICRVHDEPKQQEGLITGCVIVKDKQLLLRAIIDVAFGENKK